MDDEALTILLMASPHLYVNVLLPCVIGPVPIGELGQEWAGVMGEWVELGLVDDVTSKLLESVKNEREENSSRYRQWQQGGCPDEDGGERHEIVCAGQFDESENTADVRGIYVGCQPSAEPDVLSKLVLVRPPLLVTNTVVEVSRRIFASSQLRNGVIAVRHSQPSERRTSCERPGYIECNHNPRALTSIIFLLVRIYVRKYVWRERTPESVSLSVSHPHIVGDTF